MVGAVDIAYFPEASRRMVKGPYDIGLVEGSITTHHDAERIQQVRRQCHTLVTIGACATAGGIQALRNWKDVNEFVRYVYASPDYISTLKMSTPDRRARARWISSCAAVPSTSYQLVELLSATLAGRKPNIPTYSVCMECKRRGNVCIAVAQGVPCLGPVTQAGCGALCPPYGRGCYGCFGPMESANTASLSEQFRVLGKSDQEITRDVPHLQRVVLAVPPGERGEVNGHERRRQATRQPPASRSTSWPAWRAKAACRSS